MSFERLSARANAFGSFNRGVLVAVLALVVTVAIGSGVVLSLPAAQAQGNAPIEIRTAAELRAIGDTPESLDGNYILMNDIDLLEFDVNGETVSWRPIGGRGIVDTETRDPNTMVVSISFSGVNTGEPFTGVFDGGGYEIKNLWADTQNDCWVGLFGHVLGGTVSDFDADNMARTRNFEGTVRNVGLRDVYVSSQDHDSRCVQGQSYATGGLVAVLQNGRVESSYVVGGTVSTSLNQSLHVGGLVGRMLGGDRGNNIGGNSSTVVNSFTDVMVDGGSSGSGRVGGLVGHADANSEIVSSYTLGDVSGATGVGLLLGGSDNATIRNSFAAGTRTDGSSNLVGVGGGSINRSYQTTNTNFQARYITLANLLTATEATVLPRAPGVSGHDFRSWNITSRSCPAEAAVGAGELPWDFGTEDELPISNCIAAGVQRGLTPVRTAAQLRAIADDLGGDYFLGNDIDLEQASWTPIGSSGGSAFTGTFDGAGYEISNLQATTPTSGCEFGLFGYTAGEMGTVRNVGLRYVYVSDEGTSCQSSSNVGALVGFSTVPVRSSYVVSGTVRGNFRTGGLVGLSDFSIDSSFTDVEVVGLGGSGDVGGLVGHLSGSGANVTASYALGSVSGSGANYGGLVGRGGTVINSYASGNLPGGLGGLIGGSGTVTASYQTDDSSRPEDDDYRSLSDLADADASTTGFESWGDDLCSDDAVAGAGGAVWDFGGANSNALPRINCIAEGVVQDIVLPTVAVAVGVINGETVTEGGSIEVMFSSDVTPRTAVRVRVMVGENRDDLEEGRDYTIEPAVVVLRNAGESVVSVITYIAASVDPETRRADIGYELINSVATGARFGMTPAATTFVNLVSPGFTRISDAAGLRAIADDLDGDYILMNDISLLSETGARVSWTPLGGNSTQFSGVFDGDGYEISGLEVNADPLDCRFGLFGFVDEGTVRNVGLSDVYVSDEMSGCGDNVFAAQAGLVGTLRDGRVELSYVVGGTVNGSRHVGGLVGRVLAGGMVVNSFTSVSVMGSTALTANAGGLAGELQSNAEVRSSYVWDDVSGQGDLGGLVGINNGTIINSFAARLMASGGRGLVGSGNGTVTDSYQTSDSASANYLSLAALAGAVANTGGFGTWEDDLCPAGTPNALAPVWNFGRANANALPRISCIAASRVDQEFIVPTVTVTGIRDGEVFTEDGASVVLRFGVDETPLAPITVRVTITGTGLVEGTDYRIVPDTVTLTSAGDTAVSRVTFPYVRTYSDTPRTVDIGYMLTSGTASARLATSGATVSLEDILPTVSVTGITDDQVFTEGDSVELTFELDRTPPSPVTVSVTIADMESGTDYTIEQAGVRLTFGGDSDDVTITFLDDRIVSEPREIAIAYAITGGEARLARSGAMVSLRDADRTVAVEIPAGNDIQRVEVEDVPRSDLDDLPSPPAGVPILANTRVFDIELMDSNDAEVRNLNRPARVWLPLSAAAYRQVANPALLRVIAYHEGASNWDVLDAVYDVEAEQLGAYTSRFSVFAIGLESPPQVVVAGRRTFLPGTGDGGVLGLWGVAGLGLFGAVLILAGVLVVVRRKFPNSRSARS